MPAPIFEEVEEEKYFMDRWITKAKNNPFLTVGILGFVGCGIHGIRSYKAYRATGMSTSVFLVQLRVIAQGMVVGSLCLALVGQVYKDIMKSETPKMDQK